VPISVTTVRKGQMATRDMLYGDPSDPHWAAAWTRFGPELRAEAALPKLSGPRVRTSSRSVLPAIRPSNGTQAAAGPTTDPVCMCVDHDCLRRFCVPPNPNDAPYFGEEVGSALNSCNVPEYNLSGPYWAGRSYSYLVRLSTVPAAGVSPGTTFLQLVAGHASWDITYNDCAMAPQGHFDTTFSGDSGTRPASNTADGANVIDFGDVAAIGCPGTLACTWTFWDGANHLYETDQRYDAFAPWSGSFFPDSTTYDVWGVATHESGHSLGLAHANSSTWLTMYYQSFRGAIRARSLAQGGVYGLQARYP
jgi:Matrixin